MEEVKNLSQEEVNELVKDFPVQPRGKEIIITVNTYKEMEDDLITNEVGFDETQYIMAVGNYVQDLEPGMKVILDVKRMTIQHGDDAGMVKVDPIEVDGIVYSKISDSFVSLIDKR